MSQNSTITDAKPVRPDVQAAIARAAQATGVDFSYLLAQARLESGLDPAAQATTSSAAGLYQFTRATWLNTLGAHGDEHGLGWAGEAVVGGRIADPAKRSRVLALRLDPQAAALMAGELASDNSAALTAALGRQPDAAELYMAHFLGVNGATKFLTALVSDPSQPAAVLLPGAAAANRAIFQTGSGQDRSVGEVMTLMRGKLNAALHGAGAVPSGSYWPAASQPQPGARRDAATPSAKLPGGQLSMAQTLSAAFGLATAAEAPAHVRSAYGKLQALGL